MLEAMKVLVTGGAGFIGSHTVIELLTTGHQVVIVDNLVNACRECVNRVEQLTGKSVAFYEVDVCNKEKLRGVFQQHKIDCVIHFAGLKAVGESCEKPLLYYSNNITGTLTLLQVMEEFGVQQLVFSSSATVYGSPEYLPIDEKHPAGNCTNPYGRTKYFIEEILKDHCKADPTWKIVLLRYFNPVGAHKSGRIGEDPMGPPNNLMPYVAQVAIGRRPHLNVFGNDYNTKDGTGVRDYIHVVDLAQGHVASLKGLSDMKGYKVYNLGTGTGYSVLEMVKAFEEASGKTVSYKFVPRREGDVESIYADSSQAERDLQWTATRGLQEMCEDLWHWQKNNPIGFKSSEKVE